MCGVTGLDFGRRMLAAADVQGLDVIEVGAADVNGSLRPHVESLSPRRYLGVDLAPGRGVDEVCRAEDLVERYGAESFDVVVSTELLEHVEDWRRVVSNLKRVTKPGGVLLVTTRSKGFPYHGHPADFWRYEVDDVRAIFPDMTIEALEPDSAEPGVFVRARKPRDFREADLSDVRLYCIVSGRRAQGVGALSKAWFRVKYFLWRRARKAVHRRHRKRWFGEIT